MHSRDITSLAWFDVLVPIYVPEYIPIKGAKAESFIHLPLGHCIHPNGDEVSSARTEVTAKQNQMTIKVGFQGQEDMLEG